jgi:DNA-binding transcriptional MerR regulator
MNIGELVRATDTKPETIRYYEQIGLLPEPPRTAGNYRDYTADHVSRLTFTRRARELGFSIEQIRTLLALADEKEQSCDAVDAIARAHLGEIKRKLADLGVPAPRAGIDHRPMPARHHCRVPHH